MYSTNQRQITVNNDSIKNDLINNKCQNNSLMGQTLLNKISRAGMAVMIPMVLIAGLTGCNNDDDSNNGLGAVQDPINSVYSQVAFVPTGSYVHGGFDESAAEITAFHPASQRAFVVNAQNKKVDVLDLKDIHNPVLVQSLDVADIGSTVNSVAVHGDIVALAVQANVKTDNGY
ncbi:MAG: hypothetical protein ACR2PP_02505, partial [Psychrobacter sp.]